MTKIYKTPLESFAAHLLKAEPMLEQKRKEAITSLLQKLPSVPEQKDREAA